jgi:hypothetical protein
MEKFKNFYLLLQLLLHDSYTYVIMRTVNSAINK